MRKKDVKQKYGLWDNVYDKRVVRTLDTNTKWVPNKKEIEKRTKVKQKRVKEKKKKDSKEDEEGEENEKKSDDQQSQSGDEAEDQSIEDDQFSESRKKFIPTGIVKVFYQSNVTLISLVDFAYL